MTLLIGEWPYYWSDCTRLPVALMVVVLEAETGAPRLPREVRYRRIPFECQREKLVEAVRYQLFVISRSFEETLIADRFLYYHRMRADAHVNPAPKAPNITRSPSLIRP
jgi:hypothetical protein